MVWLIVIVEAFIPSPYLLFHSSFTISILFLLLFAYKNILQDHFGSSNLTLSHHNKGLDTEALMQPTRPSPIQKWEALLCTISHNNINGDSTLFLLSFICLGGLFNST